VLSWRVERHGKLVAQGVGEEYCFTPTEEGKYKVMLTVTDDDGGTDRKHIELRVKGSDVKAELKADELDASKMSLVVTGSSRSDVILFKSGDGTGEVDVYVNHRHQGSFMPTGRLIAHGMGGDDAIVVGRGITHSVAFYGGEGRDILAGGVGNDMLDGGLDKDLIFRGGGTDTVINDGKDKVL
jgi:Ca2+-binding RTX toxin-like protein